jgi:putative SOS response-associated peptidase YedK
MTRRHWRSGKEHKDTFAIVTTEPNELLVAKTGHDRMPLIIKRHEYQRWLEPTTEEQPPIDLVRPFDSDKMKAWRVDRRVNNVRNNEPSLCAYTGGMGGERSSTTRMRP